MILGIDEVGRGSWAGPLVVGAVVLGGAQIDGLTDSKKLTKSQRVRLDTEIRQKASGFGLGWVTAAELDEVGLSQALVLATKRAVEQINTYYDEIIIDGTVNFLKDTNKGKFVTLMKKADLLVPSVSAASIIAKVARDDYMAQQAKASPGYGFEQHVGYGTSKHSAAIDKLGVTPLHRLSFAPLKKYRAICQSLASDSGQNGFTPGLTRAPAPCQTWAAGVLAQNGGRAPSLSTKRIGDNAENVAANYLVRLGHQTIDRNWKTKYCEIDIVSKYKNTLFFTEVKYRKKLDQGGGLAAITNKKLNQMKFAANFYMQSNHISDMDMQLAVISVIGQPPMVEQYLEIQ